PAIALERAGALGVAERLFALESLLDVTPGAARCVEEHGAAGAGAIALPGMRHVAGQEGAGPGPARENLVTDLEGEFALQHPADLVAVMVQVVRAPGAGGHGLLEQHDAVVGLPGRQLQRKDAPGRVLVKRPAARGYDEPFGHEALLRCGRPRIRPLH